MNRMSIDPARGKRRKHFHAASLLKYLVGAALVFSLFALSGPVVHVKGIQSSGTWTLKEIHVFNTMDGNVATITSESYNATGGAVEINISGNILGGTCPGGNEKLRFAWQFDRNVTQVVNGGAVSASMAAGQVSKSQNCGEQIASRSVMTLVPSSGNSSSFSSAQNQLIDSERFRGSNGVRVWAAGGERNGVGSIAVNTHPLNPNNSYAYFEIAIGTPTKSNSMLRYAYLYENSGGGGGVSGGGNFTVEYDTDRRGGDYTNYDSPGSGFESCRDACANDSRCRAYTYVKPWQGNSAHCWLKSSVPEPASGLTCCISGVRR